MYMFVGIRIVPNHSKDMDFPPHTPPKKKRSLSCPSEAMSVTCHEIHGLLILEILVMAFYNYLWNWIVNPKQLGSLSPLLTSQLTANYVLCSSNPKDPSPGAVSNRKGVQQEHLCNLHNYSSACKLNSFTKTPSFKAIFKSNHM